MPSQPSNDIINPISIVIPNHTTAVKETLLVEVGTIVYDTTLNKLSVCVAARTAGAGGWEDVTRA